MPTLTCRNDPEKAIKVNYSLPQILKARNDLVDVLKFEFLNKQVKGEEFQRFVDICVDALSLQIKDVHRETVLDSVRYMAGDTFTLEAMNEVAHRLMGNIPRIRHRRVVSPWSVQRFYEWVPVQIIACRRSQNVQGEVGAMLTLKFMAGSPAPMVVLQWWSLRKCRYLSRDFGFSKPASHSASYPAPFPYAQPEQLVMLRFLALLDPARGETEPGFTVIDTMPSLRKWNRDQIKRRARIKFKCPQNYPADFPCHRCPIGYLECPAGTHRLTYVQKKCPKCSKKKAVWDLEIPAKMCIDCYMNTIYKRKESS
jgi:hypothetical protein